MHSSASAKKLHRVLSSKEIRKTFIDYFTINNGHNFVRSSPVVPFCDPTVAFVNSGMNQFKSVLLGRTQPPHQRVVNSQKCIRVGGKHNDLSVVGQDGYHHTFFEMLGNWSFGDYFKREACEMALELLHGPYNIDTRRLYVTYFGGDKELGLPPDLECFEIWRNLGFPVERILPFGSKDNFWEMGLTGPCGPCTEIHIDHCPNVANADVRAKLVNTGRPDLTELWNLVFMEYIRNEDGTITQLPARHVDTGMGFERLTAILQNKTSNYDTDLFTPLFDEIQKICHVRQYNGDFPTVTESATLDTGYRILADHARMVTVCLGDGMLPDQNQKLRRILRKALTISENVFSNETLLLQLVPVVINILGSTYPEMYAKQSAILELVAFEQEVFKALRKDSSKAFAKAVAQFSNIEDIDLIECPGLVPAYRDFMTQKPKFSNRVIPGKFLFKLTDTYGLTEENILKLAASENMSCDMDAYKEEIADAKARSKSSLSSEQSHQQQLSRRMEPALVNLTKKLPATDHNFKYNYSYHPATSNYVIPVVEATVQGVLHKSIELVESEAGRSISGSLPTEDWFFVVTDRTNFYNESGGQQSDRGKMLVKSLSGVTETELNVLNVTSMNDCIVHVCQLPQATKYVPLASGTQVQLVVDPEHRKLNICHHTATHLLNAAIRNIFKRVTYQVSSVVTRDHCKLEVGIIGKRITKEDVAGIEDLIGRVICSATDVQLHVINAADVLKQNDITMVPGEIYPESGLRLVSINCDQLALLSKELCCGTHVTNTREIQQICITNLKQTNRARYAFTAVAGTVAETVLKSAALLRHRVDVLEQQFKTDKLTNATESELQTIRNSILHTDLVLPYVFKMDTLERINKVLGKLKATMRTTLKEFVEVEMRNLMQDKSIDTHPFILHYISSSALVNEIPLNKATKICTDRPILVISMCDSILKARCCVPDKFVNSNFTAEMWLQVFADVFQAQLMTSKGQAGLGVCNMKAKKVSTQFEEQLEVAMAKANEFAKARLL